MHGHYLSFLPILGFPSDPSDIKEISFFFKKKIFNLSTCEAEARESLSSSQPCSHSKYQASLGYTGRPCRKTKPDKRSLTYWNSEHLKPWLEMLVRMWDHQNSSSLKQMCWYTNRLCYFGGQLAFVLFLTARLNNFFYHLFHQFLSRVWVPIS